MNAVPTTEVTITKVLARPGSNMTRWNVDVAGKPFGQIWTFRNTSTETHPYHAAPLNGMHRTFYKAEGGYKAAERYLRSCM